MKRKYFYFILVVSLFVSCTKDADLSKLEKLPTNSEFVAEKSLLINEFVSQGSTNVNENGNFEDWFEIYNPGDSDIILTSGQWFVTDDIEEKDKFELPEITIESKGFLLIWCDEDTGNDIHTGFKLSGSGEDIAIYFKDSTGVYQIVDHLSFEAQSDGVSYGRIPDGSENWEFFTLPTPGTSNNF